MSRIALAGCTATPFGGYLKALGVLRLVSEQHDSQVRGWFEGETFVIESELDQDSLLAFFLDNYSPTPILAPWNGGSGFYPKDNKDGMHAIAGSKDTRFAAYRSAIDICQGLQEVKDGKAKDEDARRTAILRHCRNRLDDRSVEWLDAAVGISSDGSRSFAPVLGTGGNEGRLDYTNNFMSRIAALLIAPEKKTPVRELLAHAIFGERTTALQPGAAGQYDPGRAGGPNQGERIEADSVVNLWDLVLTMEGAVAWASGLYRRQGRSFRSFLCSPFTVRPVAVGYGSAAKGDDARAEVWTPLWNKPVRYAELKSLLREGRASVQGRPAANGLEFAEAACSLGVDRGISHFIRYSLLKRRGDSYVALPAGKFGTLYRSEADLVREFQRFLSDRLLNRELPKGAEDLRRGIDLAIFQVLLTGGGERMRELVAALGRFVKRIAITTDVQLPARGLNAVRWLPACEFATTPEVRIAAAIASIYSRETGSIIRNLSRSERTFAWEGGSLPDRMISVLKRRLQAATADESKFNPLGGACALRPGDATLFIEGSVDEELIEDLLFAFATFDWQKFEMPDYKAVEVVPVYGLLKHLFLGGEVRREGSEPKRLLADSRILSLLQANNIQEAAKVAVHRLKVAGLRPLDVEYIGGVDARRLAAALLIPVWSGSFLGSGLFHESEQSREANA